MMTCGSCGYVGQDLEFLPATAGEYWCPECEFGGLPEDDPEDEDEDEEEGQAAREGGTHG